MKGIAEYIIVGDRNTAARTDTEYSDPTWLVLVDVSADFSVPDAPLPDQDPAIAKGSEH